MRSIISGGTQLVSPRVSRSPRQPRRTNGAAGGVVNIITKKTGDEWHGSWNTYMNAPEHKSQASAWVLSRLPNRRKLKSPPSGPLRLKLVRLVDINQGHQSERTGIYADTLPAGREGVKNKNIDGLVPLVDVPGVGLGFVEVTEQAEAEIAAQRAAEAEVGAEYHHQKNRR
jgi:ferric enterobactin receptor